MLYVIARARHGRVTVQHIVNPRDPEYSACGRFTGEWSRAYQREPIKEILCKQCRPS